MRQIIFNHSLQRNQTGFASDPLVIEFVGIDIFNDMNQMQVGVFPELNQRMPVFVLEILDANPTVVIPVGGVIGKRHGILAVLQMNNPMGIVRGRIDQMAENLPDTAVLSVFSVTDSFFRKIQ
jgi:hypothetical protein